MENAALEIHYFFGFAKHGLTSNFLMLNIHKAFPSYFLLLTQSETFPGETNTLDIHSNLQYTCPNVTVTLISQVTYNPEIDFNEHFPTTRA